ncbi:MAG: CHASE2 domain-containing protein [Balneolaceae bacterium]
MNDSLLSKWHNEGIPVTGHDNSPLRTSYIKSDQIRSFTTNDSLKFFELEILKLYDPNSLSALEKRNTKTEMINYIRPTRNFEEWDSSTLLEGMVSKSSIESQIVILGYMGGKVLDHFETSSVHSFVTPLKRSTLESEHKMYGIEISANIIWMILRGNYIKHIPKSVHYLTIIVIAILCTLILLKTPLTFYWGLAAIIYFFFTAAGIYLTILFLIEYNVYFELVSYHFIFLGAFIAGFIYKVIKYKNEYNKR